MWNSYHAFCNSNCIFTIEKSTRLKWSYLTKQTLNFLKKTLNYLKKTLNFLKKTLNFLKKTLNYLKKTLRLRVSEHCEIPVSQKLYKPITVHHAFTK